MLEIQKLSKTYSGAKVLSNVNMTLADGKITGLIGLNGAGKSTLMKIICGIAYANQGKVLYDGEDFTQQKTNGAVRLGFMIENPAFYPNLSGKHNLYVFADLLDGVTKKNADDALVLVGLKDNADKLFKNYSLGMKQRLYLAFAIMNRPKILVLDEPFNGIDPVSVKVFKDIITQYASVGCCVLISSHSLLDVKSVCDKVFVIDKGAIVKEIDDPKNSDIEEEFLQSLSEEEL